jgi:heme/copper-type cytochrome/quinol oxidase subunit 3
VTAVSLPRRGFPAAWWGMAILIASEAMLFGCFIATYFFLRFKSVTWPPAGIDPPPIATSLILTAALVATTVPMYLASQAARSGLLARTRACLLVALVVQTGYIAYEIVDFHSQLQRVDIGVNAYTSIYYTLLGADHGHVIIGVLFNLWLLGKLVTGLTRYRVHAVQAIAWYWFFVNAVTVVVIGTLLSAHA